MTTICSYQSTSLKKSHTHPARSPHPTPAPTHRATRNTDRGHTYTHAHTYTYTHTRTRTRRAAPRLRLRSPPHAQPPDRASCHRARRTPARPLPPHGRAVAATEFSPHALEQTQVARRQLVESSLTMQGQHLDGPRADPRDRAQPPPHALMLGVVQVGAAARHLAGDAHKQARTRTDEVEGLKARRRGARERRGGGNVAQRPLASLPARPARAHRRDDPPLNRGRALVLDQLLADRPRQRLERLGTSAGAQPRPRAHGASDQRVVGELAVEAAQIVVDAEREAHPLDPVARRLDVARARPEEHHVGRGLRDAHVHRLAVAVQQPFEHTAATAQHPVHAARQRQAKRTRRRDLDAQLDQPPRLSDRGQRGPADERPRAACASRRSPSARPRT